MSKVATKRKTAKFACVECISLTCPTCGGICVNENGSQMFTRGGARQVHCEICREFYDLPTRAIKLLLNM